MSNLTSFRLALSTFPLPDGGGVCRGCRSAPTCSSSPKPTTTPRSTSRTPDDERFLGWEPDVFLNWQITSDLTLAVRYGIFFPNDADLRTDEPAAVLLRGGDLCVLNANFSVRRSSASRRCVASLTLRIGCSGCPSAARRHEVRSPRSSAAATPDARWSSGTRSPSSRSRATTTRSTACCCTSTDDDPADDYDARVGNLLKSRSMLPKGFDQPGEQAVTAATLAVAIVRLMDIKGGVTMRLFGPSPRYATRELMFVGIYPPSSPNQTFSGTRIPRHHRPGRRLPARQPRRRPRRRVAGRS